MPAIPRAVLVLATACAAGALTFYAIVAGLDALDVEAERVFLQDAMHLDRVVHPKSLAGRIVVLTDSLGMGGEASINAGSLLDRDLRRRLGGTAPRARGLSYMGMGVYSYYLFSERLAESRPRMVILQLNLLTFSDFWIRDFRAQLAGWLPVSRWPEAVALPLEIGGMTADRMIFFRAIVASGLGDVWYGLQREQIRARVGWRKVERAVQVTVGPETSRDYKAAINLRAYTRNTVHQRATKEGARANFGHVFEGLPPDHPVLQILDAFLARFEAAGIPTVVYIPPHNMENARKVGFPDGPGLARSLAEIQAVVEGRGGTFIDLHDLLPDSAFRDYLDHLVVDTPRKPLEKVTARIADRLIEDDLVGRRTKAKRR